MSSFLVQRKTLLEAVSAIDLGTVHHWQREHATRDDVRELASLNIKGFQARYGADREDIRAEVKQFRSQVEFAQPNGNGDPLRAYKALRCVLYQAMEGNVPNTKAYKRWEAISDALAHRIAGDAADAAGVGWDS